MAQIALQEIGERGHVLCERVSQHLLDVGSQRGWARVNRVPSRQLFQPRLSPGGFLLLVQRSGVMYRRHAPYAPEGRRATAIANDSGRCGSGFLLESRPVAVANLFIIPIVGYIGPNGRMAS